MTNILCIIPARSGSKGILDKNIKLYKKKPLIAWSIEQAINCKYKMKIIVSTDSERYASIAKTYGAEVPFIRPKAISDDSSLDIEFMKHCVDWLETNEQYKSDIIVHLRPTSPLRKVSHINAALDIFLEKRTTYDSLRSVIEIEKSPYKMYNVINNELMPLFKSVNGINEVYNQCRQILPKCYLHNGYIDILNTELLKNHTISGDKIYPYVMNHNDNIDIDNENDWND
jgi:CMP-N,N'-diacetyllegionaminic acid synthase